MKDATDIEKIARTLAARSSPADAAEPKPLSEQQKYQRMDAVDQLFAELELTHHNQYHKAFHSPETLTHAKKLWFAHLKEFTAERILQAGRKAARASEFLPTIHSIIKYCEFSVDELGLPDVHRAYVEACQAPSPKAEYQWSHPAIYWAGKAADWFFLANNPESKALPVFKSHYLALCERIRQGEKIEPPERLALEQPKTTTLSAEQRRERMKQLREEVDL